MGYAGSKYTWTRGNNNLSFKGTRLDRALCNLDWNCLIPDAIVTHLPKIRLDHSPFPVNCFRNNNVQVHRLFRFQTAWLKQPGLKQVVESDWSNEVSLRYNNTLMVDVLDQWNGDVFSKRKR